MVAFYFDGAQVSSFTNSAVGQMTYMYMILDYAVGGWPGTVVMPGRNRLDTRALIRPGKPEG